MQVLEARIERALAKHGDAAIHQKDVNGGAVTTAVAAKGSTEKPGSPLRSGLAALNRSNTIKK